MNVEVDWIVGDSAVAVFCDVDVPKGWFRGYGVNVSVDTDCVTRSHQARGGACVGAGVFVGVPVIKAMAVPVAAHWSGVTGRGVMLGSGVGVCHQQ